MSVKAPEVIHCDECSAQTAIWPSEMKLPDGWVVELRGGGVAGGASGMVEFDPSTQRYLCPLHSGLPDVSL